MSGNMDPSFKCQKIAIPLLLKGYWYISQNAILRWKSYTWYNIKFFEKKSEYKQTVSFGIAYVQQVW